jgi:hypothetical protein
MLILAIGQRIPESFSRADRSLALAKHLDTSAPRTTEMVCSACDQNGIADGHERSSNVNEWGLN